MVKNCSSVLVIKPLRHRTAGQWGLLSAANCLPRGGRSCLCLKDPHNGALCSPYLPVQRQKPCPCAWTHFLLLEGALAPTLTVTSDIRSRRVATSASVLGALAASASPTPLTPPLLVRIYVFF